MLSRICSLFRATQLLVKVVRAATPGRRAFRPARHRSPPARYNFCPCEQPTTLAKCHSLPSSFVSLSSMDSIGSAHADYSGVSRMRLPGTSLKVSDSRPLIDYATTAPFAMGFLETALAIEDSSNGIWR